MICNMILLFTAHDTHCVTHWVSRVHRFGKKVPSLKAEDNHLKQHPRPLKSVIFGHRYVSNRDLSQHIFFFRKKTLFEMSPKT